MICEYQMRVNIMHVCDSDNHGLSPGPKKSQEMPEE